MATAVQRASDILAALLNAPATAAQKQRVLAAYGAGSTQTAEQIAAGFLDEIRQIVVLRVQAHETPNAAADFSVAQ